ncbi:MAG: triose-phosphate isomerase [Alphaproteobacteria bacterium]|nr:triose-phosphate isomerase [Alphaproteobacteria bacterium]
MKKIIAGNWKMNGTVAMLRGLYEKLEGLQTDNTVILCPPYTLLNIWIAAPAFGGLAMTNGADLLPEALAKGGGIRRPDSLFFGAQDCSAFENGAYTGDISAAMIAALGAKYVIVGHSERRRYHGETNEIAREKATRAAMAGLVPIVCVGDTLQDREAGRALEVVANQVKNSIPESPFILAYEPVWAISTSTGQKDATAEEIAQMHAHIAAMTSAPILFGGSVRPSNAAEIMSTPHVDGALVGGASLKPEDFVSIIEKV